MLKFKWEISFQETEFGNVSKEWKVAIVKDVAKVDELYIDSNFKENRIEYIDITSVQNGELLGIQDLSLSDAPSRAKRVVRINDTLISTVRPSLKHFAFVKKAKSNTIASTGFAVVTPNKISPRYLYYFLTSEPITIYLSQIAETQTSAYPAFNPSIIEDIHLALPLGYGKPLGEDARIGSILAWFDDLIENKKRQNEILEKTAMAVFKRWFVNFEPFSDSEFVDSALGKIPKKWEISRLDDVCEIIMGQSPPSEYYNREGEGSPFIQGKGQLGRYTPNTDVFCSCTGKRAKPKDILLTVRAPIGELNIADAQYIIGRGLASLRSENWVFAYLYLLSNKELLKASERGTTFDAITKPELESFPVIKPPQDVLEKFKALTEPLFSKILLNQKQIVVLEKVRDVLLPLLVIGKLRVEEI